jgi:asparagine synthase (glutamine-hydrolysing)
MSGIIGYIGLTNRETIYRMVKKIDYRGKDGINYLFGESYSFAALSLFNSPESKVDDPIVETSEFILLSDARIDNRIELIKKLSIIQSDIPDNNLLAACYSFWGENMAEFIVGDFAIAVWIKKERKLLLMRDHLGVRPLYYTFANNNFFAFASEPKALLTIPSVSKVLNQSKLGAYLSWKIDLKPYQNDTFFEAIKSLQPATMLTIAHDDEIIEKYYWKPELSRFNNLRTDQDFAHWFKIYFNRAVERRLRTSYEVGSQLSGGLNSSAVSAVANLILNKKNKKLYTVHHISNDSQSDETEFVNAEIKNGTYEHKWVYQEDNSFENIGIINSLLDRPDSSEIPLAMYKLGEGEFFKNINIRTLFTGIDGEKVVDHAIFYQDAFLYDYDISSYKKIIANYLSKKNLSSLFQDWEMWNVDQKVKAYAKMKLHECLKVFLNKRQYAKACRLVLTFLTEGLLTRNELFMMSKRFIINKLINKAENNIEDTLLNKEFKKSLKFNGFSSEHLNVINQPKNLFGEQLNNFLRINSSGIIESLEMLNFVGAKLGYDVCHPFLDKDLIELCIATPPHLRYFMGKGQGQLRLFLEGILSDKVLNRTNNVEFKPKTNVNIFCSNPSMIAEIKRLGYYQYLDYSKLEELEEKLRSENENFILISSYIQRAFFFSKWMENIEKEYSRNTYFESEYF